MQETAVITITNPLNLFAAAGVDPSPWTYDWGTDWEQVFHRTPENIRSAYGLDC